MQEQKILTLSGDYSELNGYIAENGIKSILLVCDDSIKFLKINDYFNRLEQDGRVNLFRFSDFKPNPLYESVVKGVELLKMRGCDTVFAVGGGSAMDVAKCIKLYADMDSNENYLGQEIVPNGIRLMALPTTAGTGSEATRYAVIYYNGEKQSVAHQSIIPSAVLFDPSALSTLPDYQKKATLMDALCHAIESFWSVNSNEQSRLYSKEAICLIMENWEEYIFGSGNKNEVMLRASNIAGKAINITQTTAGHAMCYKLTSLYNISHGHAAALCVRALWGYMLEHTENCIDVRGEEYLKATFQEIAAAMGCTDSIAAVNKLQDMLERMELYASEISKEEFEVLKNSVNPVRLKNNPVELSIDAINEIYHRILRSS